MLAVTRVHPYHPGLVAHRVRVDGWIAELLAYWRWATVHVNAYSESNRNVPSGMPFATWFGTATEEFTG
ncbi:MAG TPA: hypothetical protein VIL68_14300 [Propionibacteriaceae bacterium]